MVATLKMETNLQEQKKYPVVMAPQNDGDCRILEITMTEGENPWQIPEDASVTVYYCKPDGTGGSYDALEDGTQAWSAEGNVLTVTLAPQMFTAVGNVAAKIEFRENDSCLSTFGFWIQVQEDYTGGAVASEDYVNWAAWTSERLETMLAQAKASGLFDGAPGETGAQGEQGIPGVAQTPLFAETVEECTDTEKVYVLPDGYIYACMSYETTKYTNLAGNVQENYRQNTSGVALASSGAVLTDFIPVQQGQTLRVKGFNPKAAPESYPLVCFYTDASESAVIADGSTKWGRGDGMFTLNGDVYEWTAFILQTNEEHPSASSIQYVRINGTKTEDISNIVVTVDEEITDEIITVKAWRNTGHAFVPADYEDRIIALEEQAEAITESRIAEIEEQLANTQTAKKWAGKKWAAVGDSLTYDEYVTTSAYYHDHIADDTGITVVNMGQGGTGYKRTFDIGIGYAFYQRILNVPTDADVITIFGSGNDLSTTWETYGLGEATDTGTDTICGCINTTLDNLFSVYPTANVGIITPTPWKAFYPAATEADGKAYRMTQLCEKLIEIARMRSIPCLDLYHCSGLRPWDKNFRDAFYTKDDVESDGELGGVHLDENGHKIIAAKIKAFLASLIL